MAQVDFSNATIVLNDSNAFGFVYMDIFTGILHSVESGHPVISANTTSNLTYNTPTQQKILYTGSFTASGTSFLMGSRNEWLVSNVSFSSGDTYSFEVEIDITGN